MASDGFGRARGGPLDEGLARIARWEELRQRTERSQRPDSDGPDSGGPDSSGPDSGGPDSGGPAERVGRGGVAAESGPGPGFTKQAFEWARLRVQAEPAGSPMEELADAVREIMHRHPAFSVSMTVRDGDVTWRLQSERRDGEPQVIVTSAEPAATMPAMLEPPPPADGTPSRLAELLRENPGILDEGR